MKPDSLYNRLKDIFHDSGFNLITRVKVSDYDRQVLPDRRATTIFPNAKSIVLAGFAGRNFWGVLQNFLRENPEFRDTREGWIDDYTLLKFKLAAKILEDEKADYKMTFPFGLGAFALDFLKLAQLGGVGVHSLLGVLIHPEYGSWISLRGAVITDLEFARYNSPLSSFNPCPACSKPCISACPANTISEKGWDWEACMNFRLSDNTCDTNCASRRACPYGKEHQYSEEQFAYHHKFVLKSAREYFKK
jgi:epoxyqueuosine reductase QueG